MNKNYGQGALMSNRRGGMAPLLTSQTGYMAPIDHKYSQEMGPNEPSYMGYNAEEVTALSPEDRAGVYLQYETIDDMPSRLQELYATDEQQAMGKKNRTPSRDPGIPQLNLVTPQLVNQNAGSMLQQVMAGMNQNTQFTRGR